MITQFQDSYYRGYRTSDGLIFTGQPIIADAVGHKVNVCASDDAAKAMAEAHEQALEAESDRQRAGTTGPNAK